ncbi:MAG: sodium:solute symporter family protein, partial [Alphaproteobacteria bacterium]|nr:sodium:solute symporter family protein [Alphaproteobacteria bacterium]
MDHVFWPGVVSVFVMYGLIFGVGVWASRGRTMGTGSEEGTLDELMLAGRSLPLWLGLLSMTATWVGGGYINGTVEATYSMGLLWGLQAPIGYSLSLILGGLFFARFMRKNEYATLIDPLEIRFGKGLGLAFTGVAVLSELIWSAAILVALGSTFATVVGLDFQTSLIVSAIVAVGYTITGGLWSVAWTDAVQLTLLVVGLGLAVPYAVGSSGGTEGMLRGMAELTRDVSGGHEVVSYGDWLLLLILGGVPWNVYFQRVLATPSPDVAAKLSIGGGFLCMAMAVPALILGFSAQATTWGALANDPAGLAAFGGQEGVVALLQENPSMVLPMQLRLAVPGLIGVIGLGAVAAAVMSSVDSSILSATSMAAWNGFKRVLRPHTTMPEMVRLMRLLIVGIGAVATVIALVVPSVKALWYLCGDVVYVLLFPALVLALWDGRANRVGMASGLLVSAILRLGGGEPSLAVP